MLKVEGCGSSEGSLERWVLLVVVSAYLACLGIQEGRLTTTSQVTKLSVQAQAPLERMTASPCLVAPAQAAAVSGTLHVGPVHPFEHWRLHPSEVSPASDWEKDGRSRGGSRALPHSKVVQSDPPKPEGQLVQLLPEP